MKFNLSKKVNKTILLSLLLLLGSCKVRSLSINTTSSSKIRTDYDFLDYKDSLEGQPILPPSAEAFLSEKMHIIRIIHLYDFVFINRDGYTYLGVSGTFEVDTEFDSILHSSFLIRKKGDELSWSSAAAFRWQPDVVTYPNSVGATNSVYLIAPSNLFNLPHEIFTNVIHKVEDIEKWAAPMERKVERVSPVI